MKSYTSIHDPILLNTTSPFVQMIDHPYTHYPSISFSKAILTLLSYYQAYPM